MIGLVSYSSPLETKQVYLQQLTETKEFTHEETGRIILLDNASPAKSCSSGPVSSVPGTIEHISCMMPTRLMSHLDSYLCILAIWTHCTWCTTTLAQRLRDHPWQDWDRSWRGIRGLETARPCRAEYCSR